MGAVPIRNPPCERCRQNADRPHNTKQASGIGSQSKVGLLQVQCKRCPEHTESSKEKALRERRETQFGELFPKIRE